MEGFNGFAQRTPFRGSRLLAMQGGTIAGTSAASFADIRGTWNTSGSPIALKVAVVNTNVGGNNQLLDIQCPPGTSRFSVNVNGTTSCAGNITGADFKVGAGNFLRLGARGSLGSSADGLVELWNNANTDFTRLNFGGITNGRPGLGVGVAGVFPALEMLGADGAGACGLLVYLTKTSSTNFERLSIFWSVSILKMWTEKGSGGGTARDFVLGADGTEVIRLTSGDMKMATSKTLSVASGTNQRAGTATLVAGTIAVANTTVTANTIVLLTKKSDGGTPSADVTYTLSAGVSFTINSANVLDTSTFSYLLIEVP